VPLLRVKVKAPVSEVPIVALASLAATETVGSTVAWLLEDVLPL
jgi:hypothetical protein